MAAQATFAKSRLSGVVEHVSNVANGAGCNCVCLKCKNDLIATHGKIQDHHFRHIGNDCGATFESTIHLLAKEILFENSTVNAHPRGSINYHSPSKEKVFNGFRIDFYAETEVEPIYIEIEVTNPVNQLKELFFKSQGINSFAINLSNLSRLISKEDLQFEVLLNPVNRRILSWKSINKQKSDDDFASKLLATLGIIIFVWLLGKLINRKY